MKTITLDDAQAFIFNRAMQALLSNLNISDRNADNSTQQTESIAADKEVVLSILAQLG